MSFEETIVTDILNRDEFLNEKFKWLSEEITQFVNKILLSSNVDSEDNAISKNIDNRGFSLREFEDFKSKIKQTYTKLEMVLSTYHSLVFFSSELDTPEYDVKRIATRLSWLLQRDPDSASELLAEELKWKTLRSKALILKGAIEVTDSKLTEEVNIHLLNTFYDCLLESLWQEFERDISHVIKIDDYNEALRIVHSFYRLFRWKVTLLNNTHMEHLYRNKLYDEWWVVFNTSVGKDFNSYVSYMTSLDEKDPVGCIKFYDWDLPENIEWCENIKLHPKIIWIYIKALFHAKKVEEWIKFFDDIEEKDENLWEIYIYGLWRNSDSELVNCIELAQNKYQEIPNKFKTPELKLAYLQWCLKSWLYSDAKEIFCTLPREVIPDKVRLVELLWHFGEPEDAIKEFTTLKEASLPSYSLFELYTIHLKWLCSYKADLANEFFEETLKEGFDLTHVYIQDLRVNNEFERALDVLQHQHVSKDISYWNEMSQVLISYLLDLLINDEEWVSNIIIKKFTRHFEKYDAFNQNERDNNIMNYKLAELYLTYFKTPSVEEVDVEIFEKLDKELIQLDREILEMPYDFRIRVHALQGYVKEELWQLQEARGYYMSAKWIWFLQESLFRDLFSNMNFSDSTDSYMFYEDHLISHELKTLMFQLWAKIFEFDLELKGEAFSEIS